MSWAYRFKGDPNWNELTTILCPRAPVVIDLVLEEKEEVPVNEVATAAHPVVGNLGNEAPAPNIRRSSSSRQTTIWVYLAVAADSERLMETHTSTTNNTGSRFCHRAYMQVLRTCKPDIFGCH